MCVPSQFISRVSSFLSAVLPNGKGLVMVLRLYADESADDMSGVFRISGYLMTDAQWKSLDEKIGAALGPLKGFHMKDGDHKKHPETYRLLLNLIVPKAILAGFSVSVNKHEYDKILSERQGQQTMKYWMGSSYAFLVQSIMAICGEWCREHALTEELIAYFFEAGHPSEGDANALVGLFQEPQYKDHLLTARYASHTFLAKEGPISNVLIPSDILAWHLTNRQRGKNQMEELTTLLHVQTKYIDYNADEIRKMVIQFKKRWQTHDKLGRPRK